MGDWVTTDQLGTLLWAGGVLVLVLGALMWLGRERYLAVSAAMKIKRQMYEVMATEDLARLRGQLPSTAKRQLWDELLREVRGPDARPVRVGHVAWMVGVMEGHLERGSVPRVEPPVKG